MVTRKIYTTLLFSIIWLMQSSPALAIERLPDDPTQPFIEVELKPESTYIQSMVHYTVRLYRSSHLQRGYFLNQEIPNTVTELSHETEPRFVTRDGREYELLERHYLLFPQKSGSLELPRAVFSSRDLFVQGKPATLMVKPRPDSGTGPWLPATDIQLQQTLDLPNGDIRAGMQLKRTIIIKANGLTGAQLPVLAIPQIEGMEVQDLGSKVKQTIVDGVMIGQRIIRQLFIPNRGSNYILPAISIEWWDNNSQEPRIASLPATTLKVLDSPIAQTEQLETISESSAVKAENTETEPEQEPATETNLLLLALLLSLIVYGLLIWHYGVIRKLQHRHRISAKIKQFSTACHANDPASASDTILAWGHLRWDDTAPANILGFRKYFPDTETQAALLELDRARYAKSNEDWSGKSALRNIVPKMSNGRLGQIHKKTNALPAFYD